MSKKITILGAGNVGATVAYTLTLKNMASEIVLIDINRAKAEGEAKKPHRRRPNYRRKPNKPKQNPEG